MGFVVISALDLSSYCHPSPGAEAAVDAVRRTGQLRLATPPPSDVETDVAMDSKGVLSPQAITWQQLEEDRKSVV